MSKACIEIQLGEEDNFVFCNVHLLIPYGLLTKKGCASALALVPAVGSVQMQDQ